MFPICPPNPRFHPDGDEGEVLIGRFGARTRHHIRKSFRLGTDRPMGRISRRCPQRIRTYQGKRQGKRL